MSLAQDSHPRSSVALPGCQLSFVDVGAGRPIVFLHGNPTSSYLWRNVIPHVADLGRCLAPDLPGMGRSTSPRKEPLRFVEHAQLLDAWFDAVAPDQQVTLVLHDWGSALGFDWARRNPTRVRAIAYMESLVQPRRWEDFPAGRDKIFRMLRSPEGESMVRDDNFFVEVVLPRSVLRPLQDEEMDAYRAPFLDIERRMATLMWARELPIDGSPEDVTARVQAYADWLQQSSVPKLFINADPGALIHGRTREFCRTFPNQREVTVKGIHYVQEDSPDEIGHALRDFLLELGDTQNL